MTWSIREGDVLDRLREMPDESVQCCVTSPPYWGLRDYGVDGQIGLEASPDEHVQKLVEVFREVRRVLRSDGVLWLNYGDAYAAAPNCGQGQGGIQATRSVAKSRVREGLVNKRVGALKPKDLIGLAWMLAFALRADGWWLRSDIVWHKPNPMPESVTDRPTRSHEYVFLLTKAARYYYDAEAIREKGTGLAPGNVRPDPAFEADPIRFRVRANLGSPRNATFARNARTVWTITTQPTHEAHFATFPEALVDRCVKAGSRPGDTVLDPFAGSGTTLLVAERLGRDSLGIELNPEYIAIAERRIKAHDPTATIELAPGVKQASLFTGDMP